MLGLGIQDKEDKKTPTLIGGRLVTKSVTGVSVGYERSAM